MGWCKSLFCNQNAPKCPDLHIHFQNFVIFYQNFPLLWEGRQPPACRGAPTPAQPLEAQAPRVTDGPASPNVQVKWSPSPAVCWLGLCIKWGRVNPCFILQGRGLRNPTFHPLNAGELMYRAGCERRPMRPLRVRRATPMHPNLTKRHWKLRRCVAKRCWQQDGRKQTNTWFRAFKLRAQQRKDEKLIRFQLTRRWMACLRNTTWPDDCQRTNTTGRRRLGSFNVATWDVSRPLLGNNYLATYDR